MFFCPKQLHRPLMNSGRITGSFNYPTKHCWGGEGGSGLPSSVLYPPPPSLYTAAIIIITFPPPQALHVASSAICRNHNSQVLGVEWPLAGFLLSSSSLLQSDAGEEGEVVCFGTSLLSCSFPSPFSPPPALRGEAPILLKKGIVLGASHPKRGEIPYTEQSPEHAHC